MEEDERGEPHIINDPHAIQRKWKIHTFADILYIYPHDLVPYPDATFDLTDMHNGIYLDNMVCHNSCQCLFSQIYNIVTVQTITSEDYNNSTHTSYAFQ